MKKFTRGFVVPKKLAFLSAKTARRLVWSAMIFAILVATPLAAAPGSSNIQAQPLSAAAAPTASITQLNTKGTRPTPTKKCSQASVSKLSGIDVASREPGFYKVIDEPHYYQLYGDSLGELRAQLLRCSPSLKDAKHYAGVTAHSITWTYNVQQLSEETSLCKLVGVVVGIQIRQTLPAWEGGNTEVKQAWNRYASELKAHENSHMAFDIAAAQMVFNGLQTMQPVPCSSIYKQADATIHSQLAQLDSQNSSFDKEPAHKVVL